MNKNVGSIDKIVRYLLSVVLAILAFTAFPVQAGSVLGWVFLGLAVIFTVTASISWCPIWAAIRVSTRK